LSRIFDFNKQDKDSALKLYSYCITEFPEFYPAYYSLGMLYFEQQDYNNAAPLLKTFIDKGNDEDYQKGGLSENFLLNLQQARESYAECQKQI